MKSLVSQYTAVQFEFIGTDGAVKNATIRFTPDAPDYWCTVTREGVNFDLHYCEEHNKIAVYRMGTDQWREDLVFQSPIDESVPYDPMVTPVSLFHTLQQAWLNAEGKAETLRVEGNRIQEKLAEARAVAERAYTIYTQYRTKQGKQ